MRCLQQGGKVGQQRVDARSRKGSGHVLQEKTAELFLPGLELVVIDARELAEVGARRRRVQTHQQVRDRSGRDRSPWSRRGGGSRCFRKTEPMCDACREVGFTGPRRTKPLFEQIPCKVNDRQPFAAGGLQQGVWLDVPPAGRLLTGQMQAVDRSGLEVKRKGLLIEMGIDVQRRAWRTVASACREHFDVVAVVERAGCEDGKRLRADGGVPKIVEADGQVASRVLEAAAEKRKKR